MLERLALPVDKFFELHFNRSQQLVKSQSGGRLFFPIHSGALPLEDLFPGVRRKGWRSTYVFQPSYISASHIF